MKLVGASWGFIRRPFGAEYMDRDTGRCHGRCGIDRMAYALVRYEPELIEIITPHDHAYGNGFCFCVWCGYYLYVCIYINQQILAHES